MAHVAQEGLFDHVGQFDVVIYGEVTNLLPQCRAHRDARLNALFTRIFTRHKKYILFVPLKVHTVSRLGVLTSSGTYRIPVSVTRQTDGTTVAQAENPVTKTTVIFEKPLWDRARIKAIHMGTTAQQLVSDAVSFYLDYLDGKTLPRKK
jgi:hypothetical protein